LQLGVSQHAGLINYINGIKLVEPTSLRLPNRGEPFDYTVYNRFELPEFKLFYDTMADWYKSGYIRKDILGLQNPREDEGKENGYTAWFHAYYDYTADSESLSKGFPIEVLPLEDEYYISRLTVPSSTAIPVTAKYPERAMQLIELMHAQKGKEL